ncbi:fibroblast growth factor receptor-like [Mercenaria mercenaria]|uniref:fibroblast growth factor receptor-like n=1 Tax=Mercenaria mercenaria TaxID=6596 RepID=UPI00234E59AC|nr:fibroblast growth factor receptor-like [Mercenaria mercenaria]
MWCSNALFYLYLKIFISLLNCANISGNCDDIYSSKGIKLLNITSGWFEEYSRCLYNATAFKKVDAKYLNVTMYDLITHLPDNRSLELRYLYIQNSYVPVVRRNSFRKFINITKINLAYNRIQILEEKAFFNLSALRYIDLSNNELGEIGTSVFCHLPLLDALFLYNNTLKYIIDNAFVAVATESMTFRMDVYNNQLEEIPWGALSNISVININEIFASKNKISQIPSSIGQLTTLQVLEVQSNNLEHVSRNVALLPELQEIHLQNNDLTTLHEDMLPLINRSFWNIKKMKLGGNPWRCDCSLSWMIELVQTYTVWENLTCNEPKHIPMQEFDLENLTCGVEPQKRTNSGNLPKLRVLGISLACVLVTGACVSFVIWLWKRMVKKRRKPFKMLTNRHYYRPQSMTDVSGLSISPGNIHSNQYKQDKKQQLDVGFTELTLYGKVKLIKLLGRGAFGEVYEGFESGFNNTGRKVAIKRIKDNASAEETESLMKECENLQKVGSHQNIIEVYGSCIINGSRALVMELAEDGDLRNYLRTYYEANRTVIQNLDSSEERSYLVTQCSRLYVFMWQIAKGMEYLSSLKILHRDLAARNILLSKGPIAKISDFGLSRDIYESDYYFQESAGRLPYKWMSPETLINGKYTTKSDIWSYGVLLWEMVTLGSSPYPGILPDMLISMHKSGYIMPQPPLCPSSIYSIMVECWKHTPDQRPVFKTLVRDLDEIIQKDTKQTYINLSKESPGKLSSVDEE